MASIADALIGGAQKSVGEAAGGFAQVGEGLQQGAQLGLKVQQVQQQRQQLEQNKKDLMMKKIDRMAQAIEHTTNIKDKPGQKAYATNYLPGLRNALGLEDIFPDNTLKMLQASPALRAEFVKDRILVQEGKLEATEAVGKWADPERITSSGGSLDDFTSASQFREKQQTGRLLQESRQQAALDKEQRTSTRQDVKDFETKKDKVIAEVRSRFSKLGEKKAAIKEVYGGLTSIMNNINEGKAPNVTQANLLQAALLKANTAGAISDKEMAMVTEVPGFLGKGEGFIRKWIIGGTNPTVIANLLELVKGTAGRLDSQTRTEAAAAEGLFKSRRFSHMEETLRDESGIKHYLVPTFDYKGPDKKKPKGGQPAAGTPWERFKSSEQVIKSAKESLGKLEAKARKVRATKMANKLGVSVEEFMKALEGAN